MFSLFHLFCTFAFLLEGMSAFQHYSQLQTIRTGNPMTQSLRHESQLPMSNFMDVSSNIWLSLEGLDDVTSSLQQVQETPQIEGLTPTQNVIIFIIGIFPFLWATYEFWSRIAVGASFGTGSDSIQIRPSTTTIGTNDDRRKSRGQQVLGDDALIVAYFLFAVAIGSVGIAIYSVISSPVMQ